MNILWTNYSKDFFFAPKLSQLTTCDAPALKTKSGVSAEWVSAFALNSLFRVRVADPARQLMFSLIRRVDAAVLEYERGRELLIRFTQEQVRLATYSRSLSAFEASIAMVYQACLLIRELSPSKPSLFEKDDGSVLQRMDRIYNASKHADAFIAHGGRFAKGSTLPVWLLNEGVESTDAVLSYAELADEIDELAQIADLLCRLNPSEPPKGDATSAPDAG